jgi:hypothetical protein
METPSSLFDERLQIVARILQSVGISAVIWGTDALAHHAISSAKTVYPHTFIFNIFRETISFSPTKISYVQQKHYDFIISQLLNLRQELTNISMD